MAKRNAIQKTEDGRRTLVIERVSPAIDEGRFPIKRVTGEKVEVEADIFGDGHDVLSAVLKYRKNSDSEWTETPMLPSENDRWQAVFEVTDIGSYEYTIEGWVDHFKSWQRDLGKKRKPARMFRSNSGRELSISNRRQRARLRPIPTN